MQTFHYYTLHYHPLFPKKPKFIEIVVPRDNYQVYFDGKYIKTLVTHEASNGEIEHIHRCLVVGLDVQWRPSFSTPQNPAAILQLCVGRRCMIYQLLYRDFIPTQLRQFLARSGYTIVGSRINGDLKKLSDDYGVEVENAVELRHLATDRENDQYWRSARFEDLVRNFMGVEIDKPRSVSTSDWDRAWLTREQIKYACIDAYASFEIGRILNASIKYY